MNKYKITLEYDGTGYSGWQAQKNARSVQSTLIEAARQCLDTQPADAQSKALRGGKKEAAAGVRDAGKGRQMHREWLDVQGAGRTDAGVHALGQVAHLECPVKIHCETLRMGLNDLLPASINILSVENAHPRFHARHSAVSRSYLYLIAKRRTAFGKKYVWWIKDRLDTGKMKQALNIFQGFHDFSSFADKRMDKEASTRVDIESVQLMETGGLIVMRIVGSHFLWKMVRRIVGVTAEAGRGRFSLAEVKSMLQAYSDIPAHYTAPPSGLYLEKVLYEGDRLPDIQTPLSLL